MPTNLSNLSSTLSLQAQWTASENKIGQAYNPVKNQTTINKSVSLGNNVANTAQGGSDELYSAITNLSAGATGGVNLQSFSDILNQSSVSFSRVKALVVQLLNPSDDSTYGTSASQITIGGGANAFSGFGSNVLVYNGGIYVNAYGLQTGGISITGGTNMINFTNNGAATAGIQMTVIGGTT